MLQDGQYLKNYTLLQIILQFWKGKMGNTHWSFVTDVLLSYGTAAKGHSCNGYATMT